MKDLGYSDCPMTIDELEDVIQRETRELKRINECLASRKFNVGGETNGDTQIYCEYEESEEETQKNLNTNTHKAHCDFDNHVLRPTNKDNIRKNSRNNKSKNKRSTNFEPVSDKI